MQQSSETAFSREISSASRREWLEERRKQAASLMRDFQEWIEAVSFDQQGDSRHDAMHNEMARRYLSLIDQTFKELVRAGSSTPAPVQCPADIAGPFGQAGAGLKKVA